ncbi:hypothetical protein SVIOM342S_02285 [Streptomyces violaceorubidus]
MTFKQTRDPAPVPPAVSAAGDRRRWFALAIVMTAACSSGLPCDVTIVGIAASTSIQKGAVRHRTRAAVDAWALRAYGEIRADVAVVAANGFSVEHGLTTPDLAEAAVKRAALTAARRVVLLADSSKYAQEQFARFGALSDVDLLITDQGLTPEDAGDIERAGTEVVRA